MLRSLFFFVSILVTLATSARGQVMNTNLWVASRDSGYLRRYSSEHGSLLSQTYIGQRIEGIARDGRGNAWVTVRGADKQVAKVDRTGAVVGRFPVTGVPYGIAAARDDSVWVVQSAPSALVHYASDGEVLLATPLPGDPRGVSIDVLGDVWVTLYQLEGLVLRYDKAGTFKQAIAVGRGPWSVAASWMCCTWVVNHRQCTIDCIGAAGNKTLSIGFQGLPRDIAVDRDGGVWVAMQDFARVDHYDRFGTLLASVPVGNVPTNVSLDGDGHLWVVNEADGTISKVDTNTLEVVSTLDVGPNPVAFGDFTGYAYAMVVKPIEDTDGDSFRNRNELIAGSNPFKASDYPTEIELLAEPLPGENLQLRIRDSKNPGKRYLGYFSWTNRPRWTLGYCSPCDARIIPVNAFDPLFGATLGDPFYPSLQGTLDSNGEALIETFLPPAYFPLKLYMGFFTLDPTVPHVFIRTISQELEIYGG